MRKNLVIICLIICQIFLCYFSAHASNELLVGAYYFDGWSGINSESLLAQRNAPTHLNSKLMNSFPERQPIWGWRDDDVRTMEAQIEVASNNGVDFFSFCWYWMDDGKEFNEKATKELSLNHAIDLFMKASNKEKMKFSVMIANHTPHEIKGEANYKRLIDYLVENYFSDPQYLRIDGKPVITFFDSNDAVYALDAMEQRIRTYSGYSGLYSVSCWNKSDKFSGHSWYNIYEGDDFAVKARTYRTLINYVESTWDYFPNKEKTIPLVMAGWDRRPWEATQRTPFYLNKTPTLFKRHVCDAIRFVKENADDKKMIIIYAWNELGEGGYLVPTLSDPLGLYLKAIKKARRKMNM